MDRAVPRGKALPQGTVTFLLTDIEDSTLHWERDPQGMESRLARHDSIVRTNIERHGGVVFKTTGDGAYAAFGIAANALTAALDIQREIASQTWTGDTRLRIRMALLTDVAQQRDGDYFGPVLNRASRVLALAGGHQVLLGASTAELVWDHVPPEAELRKLGQRRLRGVKRPIDVYRVVAPYLPDDEPIRESSPSPTPSPRELGGSPTPATGETVRVYLLGRFRVLVGDRELGDGIWKKQKARQLMKCLLTRPHRRMAVDEAIDILWPESSDFDAAQKTLRSTLSALRSALGATGAVRGQGLVITQQGAVLVPAGADLWVDADAFEQTLADARTAEEPLSVLEAADALYAGDYLADDPYESWAEERREALRRQWVELQHHLAVVREQRGDIDRAAQALRRVLRTDPCDERAARALMQMLGEHDRRSEALRVFDRLVDALRGIDVEPEDSTTSLREQIASGKLESVNASLARQPSLPPPPASPPNNTQPPGANAGASFAEPRPYLPSYPFPVPNHLIGRAPELEVAEQVLERGRQGLQTLLLSAPAGTGKSALTGAIVRRAQRMGYLCLVGGGYEQQGGMPLGPFHDALGDYLLAAPAQWVRNDLGEAAADLAEIIPELRQHLRLGDDPPGSALDQTRIFGAVHTLIRALSSRWPLLICLEDLHAADAATLDLIRYLTRQARRLPLVVVGTFRADEVQPSDPLGQLEAMLLREGAVRVSLQPLERNDADQMIDSLLDGPVSPRLAAQLHEATGGNPLYLEQFVLALREDGRVDRRSGVWESVGVIGQALPFVTQAIIGQRVNRLSDRGRETLAMAALLGRQFDYAVLATALQDLDELELLNDLEEALKARFISDAPGGYRFVHGLLREVLYQSLSAPRRMVMHTRAGLALERLDPDGSTFSPAELAYHFARGGQSRDVRQKCLHYSIAAGLQATSLSAHRDALDAYSQACTLVERDAMLAEPSQQIEALKGRSDAERAVGKWSDAAADARRLIELTTDPILRAQAHETIAYALQQSGDLEAALNEVELALVEIGDGDDPQAGPVRLEILAGRAYIWFLLGRSGDMLRVGEEMLETAAAFGLTTHLMWAHDTIATAQRMRGQIDEKIRHSQAALDCARTTKNHVAIAWQETNLGIGYYSAGDFETARVHLTSSLELCEDMGTEWRALNTHRWLGRVALALGNLKEAREHAQKAYQLAVDAQDRWTADCLDLMGTIAMVEGDYETALDRHSRALERREGVKHRAGSVETLIGLGLVHQRRGEWGPAEDCFIQAIDQTSEMDSPLYQVTAQRYLCALWIARGDPRAPELLTSALASSESMPRSIELSAMLHTAALFHALSGNLDAASDFALRASSSNQPLESLVETQLLLSLLLCESGNAREARVQADKAQLMAERFESPRSLALARLALETLHSTKGRLDRAALSEVLKQFNAPEPLTVP